MSRNTTWHSPPTQWTHHPESRSCQWSFHSSPASGNQKTSVNTGTSTYSWSKHFWAPWWVSGTQVILWTREGGDWEAKLSHFDQRLLQSVTFGIGLSRFGFVEFWQSKYFSHCPPHLLRLSPPTLASWERGKLMKTNAAILWESDKWWRKRDEGEWCWRDWPVGERSREGSEYPWSVHRRRRCSEFSSPRSLA